MAYPNRIQSDLKQKIKEGINLLEIVGEHVVLRKSGANFSGLCPFHSERSPSFSVSEAKQLYHCYGCKKGGDLFQFVMEIHGISFAEALVELAERAKIALPKEWGDSENEDPEKRANRLAFLEKTSTAHRLNRFVAAYYHQNLESTPEFKNLVLKRGVSEECLKTFYLGYAGTAWGGLVQHIQGRQAPLDLAMELGLVRASQGRHFDLFRSRIIFPIVNTRGKVAGFGGRKVGEFESDPAQPKYLNSSDSILFQKSKILYGLFQAQREIRTQDCAIVVEGYFDVLAMHSAGFQNVVATCGTALTSDHLKILKKFASRVIIMFDGDEAGITATERAMEVGLSDGLVLYGAKLPEKKDPDELLLEGGGREKLGEILSQSSPLIDLRIDEQVRRALEGPEEKTQAIKKIQAWIGVFSDPIGRKIRVKDVASRLQVAEKWIDPKETGPNVNFSNPKRGALSGPRTLALKPSEVEIRLLNQVLGLGVSVLILFQELLPRLPIGANLGDLFDHPEIREVLNLILKDTQSFRDFLSAPGQVIDSQKDPGIQSALREGILGLDELGQPATVSPSLPTLDELRPHLTHRASRAWARFSHRIRERLAAAEAKKDAHLQAELMQEYLDVQRKMKEFGNFYDEA